MLEHSAGQQNAPKTLVCVAARKRVEVNALHLGIGAFRRCQGNSPTLQRYLYRDVAHASAFDANGL